MRLRHLTAVLLCLLPALAGAADPRPPRPNILWVVSEDNTFNFVAAYGDPLARTPNLDGLAARGIVFDRAYSASPVCAPTRHTIITGVAATTHGAQHMRSARALPPGVRFFPEFLRQAGYFCTNNAKTDYNTSTNWRAAWDENGPKAHFRHRRPGQPFFAVFNFGQSHESRLHKRVDLVTDPAKVKVPAYLPDTPEVRADLAQYYDCVSRADAAIGSLLEQLRADGLADDTIVFYYSDNGGVLPRSKRFLYDNGTHVAMIAHFPEKFRALAPSGPGTRSSEIVSSVDLAPTILSLTGIEAPGYFQGRAIAGPARKPAPEFAYAFRNRIDERYVLSRSVTDGRYRYIRNYLPHLPAGQHVAFLWRQASMQAWDELHRAGKLNPTQRAFFEPQPPEELFDCQSDPENVLNLAADPAHASVLQRLRSANRTQLVRTRDTGFMPEAMMVGHVSANPPAVAMASADIYPLGALLDFIDAAQLGSAKPQEVASAMRHPAPVFRYWSVTATLRSSVQVDVTPLLEDRDASVRLAAADALLRRGPNDAAFRIVAQSLEAGQSRELRLAALNSLTPLADVPASLVPLVTACAKADDEYLGHAADHLLRTR